MTDRSAGYTLARGEALEEWNFGGDVLRLLVSAARSGGGVSVLDGLAHGGGPPLHVHDAEDEVVLVLEGTLAYRVGEDQGSLDAGGLLWMPRQVPHTIANLAAKPCRFLTIATPGGIEELFRAQSAYLGSLPTGTPPDPAAMARLNGAETRRVVGPPLNPSPDLTA